MAALPSQAPLFPLIFSRLFASDRGPGNPGAVWIQGVSVGEVEVALTLAELLSSLDPGLPLLFTSTTPAGVGLLSRRRPGAWRPFPLDFPSSVRRFFDATRPRLLVLVETELWPAVLGEAKRRAIPVLVVNARLSERSARRYRRIARLFGGSWDALTRVLARTREDAARFEEIGVPPARIAVGGDLKFDRAPVPAPAFAGRLRRLAGGRPILVAGSIAESEIPLVLEVRHRLSLDAAGVFLVLAPRQPESFDTAERRARADGLAVVRRSSLEEPERERADVFLLDSVGELAGTYALGEAALLGGSFAPKGGHNVLEPLRAGAPVVHGPSTDNIRSALEAAEGAVFAAADARSAADALRPLLTETAARARATAITRHLFAGHAGAARTAAEAALQLASSGAPGA
ncbi:MAG TPA: glycosyltransferase N-terminal domain-containing protein [Thermoanaerobaculia bacterium]|nr:glycosyltransferase N-terminal domain-containing protein [Thermoanaerobaculia bacterium]